MSKNRLVSSHGAEEEPAVPGGILQHFLCGAVIGHIAAALAGNQQLLAQPVVALQKQHLLAIPGCGDGREHTRRPAADDNSVVIHLIFSLSELKVDN